MKELDELIIKNNRIREFSPEIGNLENLTFLYATGNHLKSLPEEFGKLRKLRSCYLDRNPLQTLPASMFAPRPDSLIGNDFEGYPSEGMPVTVEEAFQAYKEINGETIEDYQ